MKKCDIYKNKGELTMTFNDYQKKAKSTAIYLDGIKEKFPNLPNEIQKILGLSYVSLGLGEVGELQNKIKKVIRDSSGIINDDFKEKIIGELGDCLWYIANICEELDISMEAVAYCNTVKLASRKERNVLKGSGDNR